jgi:hypothetical protein
MEKEKISEELLQKFITDALLARKVMLNILNDPEATDKDKLTAARDLLDRAGFRPTQQKEISGRDGEEIKVVFVEPVLSSN